MNANIFDIDIRIDQAGHVDQIAILGAGSEDDPNSVINAAETSWDLVLEVEPSESRDPYDAALIAAGFEPVGDSQARRA